jgi:Tol biopolymer transport system component
MLGTFAFSVRTEFSVTTPRWSPDGKYLVALDPSPTTKLMLFTFATKTWEELASGHHGWPCWSHDSKFVYAWEGDSLVRVAISDHKKVQIANMHGVRATSYYYDRWNYGWFGMTPDGRPITLRDTGIQEIYAFDLEYK